MLKEKLFAFAKPINYFLDMPFDAHVNVYAKKNLCFLAANQYQLSDLNIASSQDILGVSMYDVFDSYEAKCINANDVDVMNKQRTLFFIEEATFPRTGKQQFYFSVKTTLSDSGNHAVGIFGLSCMIESISLAQLIKTINKFSLTPSLDVHSISTLSVLNHSFSVLTKREQECAYYLTRSMTYKEIANTLNISARTVETHIENIKNKLGCYNKSGIVDKVFEEKIK